MNTLMAARSFTSAISLALAALLVAAPAVAQRSAVPVDLYGYTRSASAPGCAAGFIDIAATGTVLAPTAQGAAAADDDGAAVLTLAAPFELYGMPATQLVVSTNGYLAPGSTSDDEAGSDFSNDCPLPSIPDAGAFDDAVARNASPQRIAVLHDDLQLGNAGALHAQHFPTCPRAAASGAAEACTVVQWSDVRRVGDAAPLDFQAVLYHSSFEVAFAYRAVGSAAASSATIALQNAEANTAAVHACNDALAVVPGSTVCFFDPRFPPGSLAPADALFEDSFE